MIERILEQERAIRSVLSNDRKSVHLIPSWQDIQVLESIKLALSPLHSLTDILSGEKHVTVSAVMPLLHQMNSVILLNGESDTQLTKDIKARVKAYMDQKYSDEDIAIFLNTASYLDPRFKEQYMDEASKEVIRAKLIEEGQQLCSCEPPPDNSQPSTTTDTDSPVCSLSTPNPELQRKKRKLSDLFTKKTQPPSSVSAKERVTKEMECYTEFAALDADSDPLEWWKLHGHSYPTLRILVQKYLCTCGASSASERAFSTSGNILSSKRTCLNPSKLNMLVFLSKNL